MGFIKDLFAARANDKKIVKSEGLDLSSHASKGGKHAKPTMCTFMWETDVRGILGGKSGTLRHQCGNAITNKATSQCNGQHVCRRFDCKDAVWNAATGRELL